MITGILIWIAIVIFWISVFAIFHSYVLFPVILKLFAKRKPEIQNQYSENDDLPKVSILMAAFNEEEVIVKKIESIYNTKYPKNKLEVHVGSDNSTDNTNTLLEELSKKYDSLYFQNFTERQGKPNIINQLYDKSKGEILILTDANVFLDPETIFNLVKYYKNEKIGLVDSNMINVGLKKEGISYQEKSYISREVIIKNNESNIWGTMIGPFGGCYSIRKTLYTKVPKNYLVDDFFINMKVFEQGFKAINSIDAKVYEDVSNNLKDEFRRKIRIATGNFQNLKTFGHLLHSSSINGLAFCFLSHKVLRWLGPFLFIIAFITNLFLGIHNKTYEYLFYIQCFTLIIPIIEHILRKLKIHIITLRFITHFYTMNLALLLGFFKFIKGVKSNVWKPTKRNQ